MAWKYDEDWCVCGDVESQKHVLFYCNFYVDVRRRWKEKMDTEHFDVYEAIKGYEVNNECIGKETMWYLRMVWTARQGHGLIIWPVPHCVLCERCPGKRI